MAMTCTTQAFDFNSHAHVERDDSLLSCLGSHGNFNSHAHVERDISADVKIVNIFISTHTLTWSVTALKFYNDKTTLNFNSHAHVERDFFNSRFSVFV